MPGIVEKVLPKSSAFFVSTAVTEEKRYALPDRAARVLWKKPLGFAWIRQNILYSDSKRHLLYNKWDGEKRP